MFVWFDTFYKVFYLKFTYFKYFVNCVNIVYILLTTHTIAILNIMQFESEHTLSDQKKRKQKIILVTTASEMEVD